MADTPWGKAAEEAWSKCLYMQAKAAADIDYEKRCIICGEKVFYVEDVMARMKGHIYTESGHREYSITRMCEFCFDQTADLFDDVVVSFFKRFPHDSMALWETNGKYGVPSSLGFDSL